MTIKDALSHTIQFLKAVSQEPQLESELLLAHVLNVERVRLSTVDTTPLSAANTIKLQELVKRRQNYEPLAYLLGQKEFYKQSFFVTPDVLIPRPETEGLIDLVLDWTKTHQLSDSPLTIADIGTGSGAIAITLARLLPSTTLLATDLSNKALRIAKKNAAQYKVARKTSFYQGSLLGPIKDQQIDIIVANLPYIPSERIAKLAPDVKDYEPKLALDGGQDGFDPYRALLDQIAEQNHKPKLIVFEIDMTQGKIAQEEITKRFPSTSIKIHKDFSHFDRFVSVALRSITNFPLP